MTDPYPYVTNKERADLKQKLTVHGWCSSPLYRDQLEALNEENKAKLNSNKKPL